MRTAEPIKQKAGAILRVVLLLAILPIFLIACDEPENGVYWFSDDPDKLVVRIAYPGADYAIGMIKVYREDMYNDHFPRRPHTTELQRMENKKELGTWKQYLRYKLRSRKFHPVTELARYKRDKKGNKVFDHIELWFAEKGRDYRNIVANASKRLDRNGDKNGMDIIVKQGFTPPKRVSGKTMWNMK